MCTFVVIWLLHLTLEERIALQLAMISILLASYNGEKFIAEQIESVLCQTVQDFYLYIRDDKSTDGTLSIVNGYAERYANKVFVSQNEANSGGAKHNFMNMMIERKDDYVMLCDQDDVWRQDKIEVTLNEMLKLEKIYNYKTPLLVQTDLVVVDENLETLSPSYKIAMNMDYRRTKLENLVIQNTLTGCTVMYNHALADLITEDPPFMVMHDWWLMLVASAFGKIGSLDSKTVLYRQHGENEIGAKDVRSIRYRVDRLRDYGDAKRAINETYLQAQSFLEAFKHKLCSRSKKLLSDYGDIPNHRKLARWIIMCRLGTYKNNVSRKIAQFVFA